MNMNQGILTPLIPFLGACIYGDAEKFYATFKGKEDCKKRLEQLADHLDASLRIAYDERGNTSYSVLISGFPCDLTMPGGVNRMYDKAYWILREPGDEWGSLTKTAASISREYKLDQKEVEIFLRALPLVAEDPLKKDDFWGWMYRCGCDCEDFCWEVIFAALIAPDCKENVVKTVIDDYVNTSYWDGIWWQSEPSKYPPPKTSRKAGKKSSDKKKRCILP